MPDGIVAHGTIEPPERRWQSVRNEVWPYLNDEGQPTADPRWGPVDHISPRVPVEARIVFEHDGQVILEGRVARWANGCTYVEVNDRRLQTRGVWLADGDVRRR